MRRLDRLAWEAGIVGRAYGLNMGVRTNAADLLSSLKDHFPYSWKPGKHPVADVVYSLIGASRLGADRANARFRSTVSRMHQLYWGSNRIARTEDFDELLDVFESHTRRLVAEYSPTRVFVHAGVVSWRGQAILIPGRSFSGKTTLVHEFLRAGATYYSDEYAVFDAQGRVHPYIKPLSIREDGDGPQTHYAIEDLGFRSGTRPLSVAAVVVTSFRARARWRPLRLSPGQTALALLENTVQARRKPGEALASFQHAASSAIGLKGPRGDAATVVRSVVELLG